MIELTEGRRRVLRRTAFVAVPALVATLAVLHPGAAVSQVDLNDGAVWLTNGNESRIGRYNPVVDELNAGLVTLAGTFDVRQDGMDVLLVERNRISVVDPASVALGAMTDIPYGAEVSMAGGTTAVTRPSDGAVFAAPTQGIGALQVGTGEPAVALGEGGAAVVARSGQVLAVEPDRTVHRLDVGADGAVDRTDGALVGGLGEIEQITAVGDEVAVLAGGHLHTTRADVDLTAYGGRLALQEPGPDADTVLVSTTTALLRVPLDGGKPEEIVPGGSGVPTRPVLVAGCAHAAWASPAAGYVIACAGAAPQVVDLRGIASSDTLVFRVNRDVVVLNDVISGRVWLPTRDPEAREPNWEDIQEAPTEEDQEPPDDSLFAPVDLQAECAGQPTPPTAEKDEYGTRPGATLVLPVLANDGSSACGVLAITEFTPIDPSFGVIEMVHGGRALQLITASSASGTVEFSYTVGDGRGDTTPATGTVVLTARPEGTNAAPEQPRTGSMTVELGGAGTYDVLTDFLDPDGDQLVLLSAVAQSGGTARARADGRVRFQSDNSTLGRHLISLVVTDGTETFTGELYVDVRPTGSVPPVIEPVHAVAFVDETVTVHPVDAVRTQSREAARLAGVDEVMGLTLTTDTASGTFTAVSRTPGIFYVPFTIAAPPQQAMGLARIDVVERPETASPPVPVLDLALLPAGGEVTIDPLANDTDTSGGVLVLQAVDTPADSGLQAAVLDHRLVRFTTTRTLEGPVTVTYRVSNGGASAVGTVQVQPVPPAADQQAPVVPDVEASVRTGGVVTIPVLENAFDPDGDPLTLTRELPDAPTGAQGLMFVSGDVLRYQAPEVPTEVAVTFTVEDPMGNATSAVVTVTVHESDPETKAPAQPVPLTARVYSGETVDIPVPLTGIDPDGDGLLLLGPDQTPAKGIVTVGAADQLVYEAFPGESGTDTFTYAVEDWTGRRAVATVRVGIAERPPAAAQVITRDDHVAVRPGQSVDVLVLGNDTDTGGGELELDPALQLEPGVDATVQGSSITVRTSEPGLLQILYTARNDRGGQGTGMLVVEVAADAPILPPIARDVVVPARDTVNATSVEVDVLALAQNPSGPLDDLEVRVDPSAAAVAAVTATQTVQVTLVDHAQTLPYYLLNTDPAAEGVSSYAFIVVPALGDFPPLLRPGANELSVLSGEPLEIDLEELVQVAPGRSAMVDDRSTVQAAKADGSDLVVDDSTLRFVSQPGYAGPASISALISDGPLDDPTTHSRTLTFPITVLAAEQVPPVFTPSVLDVAPGDTSRVDLAVFTSAPVETTSGTTPYTFAVTSTPPGFTVRLEGSVLSVTPADSVPRGTVAGIPLTIEYGGDEPVVAQVDVRVVASSRALARVLTHVVPDGVEGRPTTVSVLDGAYNPFDTPLTVLDAVVETPDSGTAEVSGSQVTVRPDTGFIGQMVTRYTVRDATGDLDRVVEGRIVLTVRGAPDPPTAPSVTEPGDGSLRVTWNTPVNNGAPIDTYRITAVAGGSSVTECEQTTCVVSGLQNDVTYRFTVAAHNAVGWSEESAVSGEGRPDVLPEAPTELRVTRRDATSLSLAWSGSVTRGSAVEDYEVRVSPASSLGATFTTRGPALSYTIEGLTTGTDYTVQVCAHNDAAEECGPLSQPVTGRPARAPDRPASVNATRAQVDGEARITVTWTPPAFDGGEPVTEYLIRVDGTPPETVDGSTREYAFSAEWRRQYSIVVQAKNDVGVSDGTSTTGEVWRQPGAVTNVVATATSGAWGDGSIEVTWPEPPEVDGAPVTGYVVRYGDQERRTLGTSLTLVDLMAGQYTFSVSAETEYRSGGTLRRVEGAAGNASATVTTVPQSLSTGEVTVTFSADGTAVSLDWGPLVRANGGSAITSYTYTLVRGDGTTTSASVTAPRLDGVLFPGQHEDLSLTVSAVNGVGPSEPRTFDLDVRRPPAGGGAMYPAGTILHPGSARRAL